MSYRESNHPEHQWENSEWRNIQAGEFVLGTLEGNELLEFLDRLEYDDNLLDQVRDWEQRLQPLADATESAEPPSWVWNGIVERIAIRRTRHSRQESYTAEHASAQQVLVHQKQLSFWRSATALACAACIGLVSIVWIQHLVKPPVFDAISVVSGEGRPLWVINASVDSTVIKITAITPPEISTEEVHQLWMAKPEGDGVISLGLLPQNGMTSITIARSSIEKDVIVLGVSLEPAGGSKELGPSGPVLYHGDFSLVKAADR